MPRGNVPAPQVKPAPYTLLSVVPVVTHRAGDEHWLSGMYWDPVLQAFKVSTVDDVGTAVSTVIAGSRPTLDPAQPVTDGFGIQFTDLVDTAFGTTLAERKRLLQESAEISTSTAVEHELWRRFVLEGGTDVTGTATTLVGILASIEQNLNGSTGAAGLIHASRRVATHLIEAGLAEAGKDDNAGKLVTGLGTPVVAGFGYGDDYIFGTGLIEVHLGPVDVIDVFAVETNTPTLQGERTAGVVWDKSSLISATVTL